MSDKFVKVDLHLHTPTSTCYTGKKEDEEYLRILLKSKEENIKVVSITDHNSIAGYKKLMQIKEDMIKEMVVLKPFSSTEQVRKRLEEIETTLKLFESILILPGVEFQTSNCIHMLIIFNPTHTINEIEDFLLGAGFDSASGDVSDSFSRWCILDLYENCKKMDCLCIDAHTDSEKGILTTLKGKIKGEAFRNDLLTAISYKSELTIQKIESLLSNKEYKRSSPISFVKFSDAHNLETIGKHYTWMKLDALNYESLKIALNNPIECVSTEEPQTLRILQKLIDNPNSVFVEKVDDYESIAKSIIALANTEGGFCLIGVNADKTKIGVDFVADKENYNSFYESVSKLWLTSGEFQISIEQYELQGKKTILSVRVHPGTGLAYLRKDEAVFIKKNNTYAKASLDFIESKIESNMLTKIEKRVQPKIDSIETDLALIKDSFDTLRIISSMRNQLVSIRKYVDVEVVEIESGLENTDLASVFEMQNNSFNGVEKGNVIIIDKSLIPRFPYTYLRITPPVFGYTTSISPNIKGGSILISDTGCVFMIDEDSILTSDEDRQFLVLTIKDNSNNRKALLTFLALYLKSSFILWYSLNQVDTVNIFLPHVLRKIRTPMLNLKNPTHAAHIQSVVSHAEKIIKAEKEFLRECELNKVNNDDSSQLEDSIQAHNDGASSLFYSIDREIYDLLQLKENAIDVIERQLRYSKFYVPPIKDIEDIVECSVENKMS